ncbi:MAG: heavy-metal-associated domain-containing protein [Eubacteriales bacterium]
MQSIYFHVASLPSKHQQKQVKRALGCLPGVKSVTFSPDHRVGVDYDPTGITPAQLHQQLSQLGCPPLSQQTPLRGVDA